MTVIQEKYTEEMKECPSYQEMEEMMQGLGN